MIGWAILLGVSALMRPTIILVPNIDSIFIHARLKTFCDNVVNIYYLVKEVPKRRLILPIRLPLKIDNLLFASTIE